VTEVPMVIYARRHQYYFLNKLSGKKKNYVTVMAKVFLGTYMDILDNFKVNCSQTNHNPSYYFNNFIPFVSDIIPPE